MWLARQGSVDVDLGQLVHRHQRGMLRIAFKFLKSRVLAEDAVQDTWAAVIENLSSFEGRCSLKTWIFRILENKAKSRLAREFRSVPYSALSDSDLDDSGMGRPLAVMEAPAVEHSAEAALMRKETMRLIERAIEQLPPNQRVVVKLRDIEDLDPGEICSTLQIGAGNQRVLLHRGRGKLRQALGELRAA